MNTLYTEFEVERLKRYLDKNPHEAYRLAIAHFSDYLELTAEYKKLEKQLNTSKLPPLPNQTKIQADYEELLEFYIELQKAYSNLGEDNRALRDLVNLLAEDIPIAKNSQPVKNIGFFGYFWVRMKQIFRE